MGCNAGLSAHVRLLGDCMCPLVNCMHRLGDFKLSLGWLKLSLGSVQSLARVSVNACRWYSGIPRSVWLEVILECHLGVKTVDTSNSALLLVPNKPLAECLFAGLAGFSYVYLVGRLGGQCRSWGFLFCRALPGRRSISRFPIEILLTKCPYEAD